VGVLKYYNPFLNLKIQNLVKTNKLILAVLALSALPTLNSQVSNASAQGTAFTYQGRLNSSANPANGSYDLAFTLFNTNVTGVAVAGPVTNNAIAVSNGLFTTVVDFGPGVFTGTNNWLEIAVRNTGTGSFATLTPRQQLTPAPYAITAESLASVAEFNTVGPGQYAAVGGGGQNTASGFAAIVAGGNYNSAYESYATVGGGYGNASSFGDTVAGGVANTSTNFYGTVGGGFENFANGYGATIAGGFECNALADYGTVGGGYQSLASGVGSFVGGGGSNGSLYGGNSASGEASTVDGGLGNTNTSNYGAICGGAYNYCYINGYETIIGGSHNYCSGDHATIVGGGVNLAAGAYSLAAGSHAQAVNDGSFVWNDGTATTYSTANDQFMARASGGFVFYTGSGSGGAQLAPGATSWTTISDRNAKKNFRPVNSEAILEKLATIPIEQWNYKWEKDTDVPNIGPMAQDFKSAFYPGRDEKGISTLEFDGVELAAIQGLNRKLEETQQAIKAKDAAIQLLQQRLEALEQMFRNRQIK
jgi:hypothetical protein